MKSVYFREGQHYSFQELLKCFSIAEEKLTKYITLLKSYSVLKTVRREKLEFLDLSDQDFIVGEISTNSNDFVYQFVFSLLSVVLDLRIQHLMLSKLHFYYLLIVYFLVFLIA